MMMKISFPVVIDFDKITKQFIKANDVAMTETAARVLTPLRANQPAKTRKLRSQTVVKYFRSKRTKLLGASLQVLGERRFVNNILENGAKSHGGRGTNKRKIRPGSRGDRGPIAARHVFEKTWRAIESQAVAIYTEAFLRALQNPK